MGRHLAACGILAAFAFVLAGCGGTGATPAPALLSSLTSNQAHGSSAPANRVRALDGSVSFPCTLGDDQVGTLDACASASWTGNGIYAFDNVAPGDISVQYACPYPLTNANFVGSSSPVLSDSGAITYYNGDDEEVASYPTNVNYYNICMGEGPVVFTSAPSDIAYAIVTVQLDVDLTVNGVCCTATLVNSQGTAMMPAYNIGHSVNDDCTAPKGEACALGGNGGPSSYVSLATEENGVALKQAYPPVPTPAPSVAPTVPPVKCPSAVRNRMGPQIVNPCT